MNHKEPLVSIIAACYNHAPFVVEALESIRSQTYGNIELIITDDGSKDDSVAIINQWIAQHNMDCTFIVNEKNEGICKTFNKGLACCHGKYFQVIACDDVMLPHKIQEQVAVLEAAKEEVAVVYTDAIVINEHSEIIQNSFDDFWGFKKEQPQNMLESLIQQNTIIAPSSLVRLAIVNQIGQFDEQLCYEDWDMWLRLVRDYQFIKMKEPLVKYRHFSTSMSQGQTYRVAMAKDSIKLLDKHRGITARIDALIDEAQRPFITALIEHNDATTAILWKKVKYERSAYSIFMFLCSLMGIDAERAHLIKSKIKR